MGHTISPHQNCDSFSNVSVP
uniref:Uncharacterized protein n=1 Tax=Anguilla anguilla TaxID=7936 RepID=A0A0E9TQB3_ANGAN